MAECLGLKLTLTVQVLKNHILTQHLYYNYYSPNPKYLILGHSDAWSSRSARGPVEVQSFGFRV